MFLRIHGLIIIIVLCSPAIMAGRGAFPQETICCPHGLTCFKNFPKNFLKNAKNPIDKRSGVWYNYGRTEKERTLNGMKHKFEIGDVVTVIKAPRPAELATVGKTASVISFLCCYDHVVYKLDLEGVYGNKILFDESCLDLVLPAEYNHKFVITIVGTSVVANEYRYGKKINSARARCSPDDKFDFYTGARIALERLGVAGGSPNPKQKEEPAEESQKELYTGIICCVYAAKESGFTVGKLYTSRSGEIVNDRGEKLSGFKDMTVTGINTFINHDNINAGFIELKT